MKNKLVRFINRQEPLGESTFSSYYSVHVCPKCKHVLNENKARYDTKCCYICGYSNCTVLFDTQKIIVRDRFINGEFIETICQP